MVSKVCHLCLGSRRNPNRSPSIAVAEAGIAGRGVLLDFYEYAQVKSLDYEPWSQCV